jgi:hypothetical protein
MKRILFFIFLLIASQLVIWADNVQFIASAPRVVEVGEQFEITYTLSAQPTGGFRAPEFKGLNLLGGPSQSTSSNVQYINGKVTQSVTYSYSYYFSASKPGTYTFEPAKVTVDGKSYLSNGITIEVAGGAARQNNNPQQQQAQQQGANGNQQVEVEAGNDDIFVRVIVDRTTLYQGEHLVATIKLFSRLNISTIDKVEYPSFNGFFRQDIETQPLRQLDKEVVNGQVYGTGVIQKMVLMPQKSGELVIDPFTLQAVVQIAVRGRARSVWDDFWGPQVKEVRKKVESKTIKINVKPLPAGAPSAFKGAVGVFNFKATLDKQNVKTNDAINLKVVISGNGNLKMIEPLEVKFPSDFETYDPKVNVNTQSTAVGSSGTKTFEYLIIPRHSGNFKIEPLVFAWFDTQTKQYKTLSSGEFLINVEKSGDEGQSTVVSGVSKEDVKFLGKDIQFIKTQTTELKERGDYLFGSFNFWMSYIGALLVFLLSVVFWRKRIKANSDIVVVRNRKANKVAQKRLKDAHLYMKENKNEAFYEYILKALWGYMSDKLAIPVSELSRDNFISETSERNVDDDIVQKFLSILDTCEYARYAPAEGTAQMELLYKDAIEVISKMEQKVR